MKLQQQEEKKKSDQSFLFKAKHFSKKIFASKLHDGQFLIMVAFLIKLTFVTVTT
jgi:hypothetical protein